MNIKWNWGTKLALWITVFILFMLGLVFMTILNDITLVEKDYYPKGLDYQNRIDEMENARLEKVSFTVKQLENEIEIHFSNVKADSGTINFFRPSNNQMDRIIHFNNTDNGVKHLDINDFHKGKYIMKISWKNGNKNYYLEQVMNLR